MSLSGILSDRDRSLGLLADVAIVGTAKNVGKTTTLNYLLERLGQVASSSRSAHPDDRRGQEARSLRAGSDLPLGLTSVGRDGEEFDAVTDLPKPRISPPVGSLVATARIAARRSGAALAYVAPTPYRTALGDVGIYRVVAPDPVEIAGPVTIDEASGTVALLRRNGARRVLVDGAIDRRASASSRVVTGVILATGMAMLDQGGGRLGSSEDRMTASGAATFAPDPESRTEAGRIAEVVRRTRAIVAMLSLPSSPHIVEAEPGRSATGALLPGGSFVPFEPGTTLDRGEFLVRWLPDEAEALVLQGALTETVARALLASRRRDLALVVPDGTHVLCEARTFDALGARGLVLQARSPITVLAITANPSAPYRPSVPSSALVAALREALPLPVFDVVAHP